MADGYIAPKQSPEQITNRVAKNTGQKRSKEVRQKMRTAQKEVKARLANDEEYKTKLSKITSNSLNNRSDEEKENHRKKLSAAKKKAPMSLETRAQIALSNKAKIGMIRSQDSCERMRQAALNRKAA